jgi:hypothetical protein
MQHMDSTTPPIFQQLIHEYHSIGTSAWMLAELLLCHFTSSGSVMGLMLVLSESLSMATTVGFSFVHKV